MLEANKAALKGGVSDPSFLMNMRTVQYYRPSRQILGINSWVKDSSGVINGEAAVLHYLMYCASTEIQQLIRCHSKKDRYGTILIFEAPAEHWAQLREKYEEYLKHDPFVQE